MALMRRSLLFVCFLVVVAGIAAPVAEGQLGIINQLLGLIRIQGTLFCTLNGNVGANGSATPVFPILCMSHLHDLRIKFPPVDALVQLQCGSGNVISTATTNGSGAFSILLDPLNFLLSSLLSNCNLAVKTPLASCNSNLPSVGGLLSPLRILETTTSGLVNIVKLVPIGFELIN